MTVNLAWRSGSDIFLVVDSLLTFETDGAPRQPLTSAGEPQTIGPNRVEERGAKLAKLTSHVAASWSGEGSGALPALVELRTALGAGMRLPRALERLVHHYEAHPPFTLLVASSESDSPGLWAVSPSHPTAPIRETYVDRELIFTGSLPRESQILVKETITSLFGVPDLEATPPRMLATAIMLLQAHGQRVDLASHGVGGAFFGARIGRDGVQFQDDIVYVLFRHEDLLESSASRPRFLFTGVRDARVLLTWSTTTVKYKAFAFDIDHISHDEIHRCMDGVLEEFKRRPPLLGRYYGFIDRDSGALVQVACNEGPPRHLFNVDNGSFRMVNMGFVDYLRNLSRTKPGEPVTLMPLVLCDDEP